MLTKDNVAHARAVSTDRHYTNISIVRRRRRRHHHHCHSLLLSLSISLVGRRNRFIAIMTTSQLAQ